MKKTDAAPCSICRRDPAKVAGMCSACYSWWGRIKYFEAPQLSAYLARIERSNLRIGSMGGLRAAWNRKHSKKVLPFFATRARRRA